jgi:hypothetical protein
LPCDAGRWIGFKAGFRVSVFVWVPGFRVKRTRAMMMMMMMMMIIGTETSVTQG